MNCRKINASLEEKAARLIKDANTVMVGVFTLCYYLEILELKKYNRTIRIRCNFYLISIYCN